MDKQVRDFLKELVANKGFMRCEYLEHTAKELLKDDSSLNYRNPFFAEIKEFLESLTHGLTPTISYPEWERWVRARAARLLGKEDSKPREYRKYRNIDTQEIVEWARDEDKRAMVDRDGNWWMLCDGFYGHNKQILCCADLPLSSPGQCQPDIDALKCQVTALEKKLSWKDASTLSKLELRAEGLEATSRVERYRLSDLVGRVEDLESREVSRSHCKRNNEVPT